MNRILAISGKELRLYFLTPTSYFAFAIYILMSSFMFYVDFVTYQPSIIDYRLILSDMLFMLLIVVPILTMRLISEEFRQGTDELLLTSPASVTEVVLGKYLASLGVLLMLLVCNLVYPAIMSLFGNLNMLTLWLSLLGVFLMGASMMAIGLFASALSQHQMVSAVAGFVLLLLFWLAGSMTSQNETLSAWIQPFSLPDRISNLTKGVINGPDVIFYVSLAVLFVVLSIQVIERKRWR
ncbi:ABC transporter permease [Saccharibacillus alkalitolerans]|uniref:ABC transporter permease n=1 Tax=Saccharibacillus alkalitolerans TaxID=2705290 RepID=A0ABX0F8C9_9BACL|nr:ABC transporter permease [Saccharibacillus alkalitolerans]NGZ76645.1 ABC transporter permease [Saccharibacillus alkalitolerans]